MATGFVFHERYLWHNTGRQAGPFQASTLPAGWSRTSAIARTLTASAVSQPARRDRPDGAAGAGLTPRPATVEELLPDFTSASTSSGSAMRRPARRRRRRGTPSARARRDRAALRWRRDRGGRRGACRDGGQRLRAGAPAGPSRAARSRRGASACSATPRSPAGTLESRAVLDRVAIVDWDVHHGNGTQAAFWEEPRRSPSRFTRTTAFRRLRPLSETRRRHGEGFNLNIPLRPARAWARTRPPSTASSCRPAAFPARPDHRASGSTPAAWTRSDG